MEAKTSVALDDDLGCIMDAKTSVALDGDATLDLESKSNGQFPSDPFWITLSQLASNTCDESEHQFYARSLAIEVARRHRQGILDTKISVEYCLDLYWTNLRRIRKKIGTYCIECFFFHSLKYTLLPTLNYFLKLA